MSRAPHIHTEALTPDEDTEARRQQHELPYAMIRAAKSVGGKIANRGGHPFVLLNPERFGLEPPAADDEHGDLKLPHILPNSVFLPTEGRTLTPLAFTDPFRKTPKKEREFLAKWTREPELPTFFDVEAGNENERRAVEDDLATALAKVAPVEGEPLRACIIKCRDKDLAVELAEQKRDALPWREGLKLRPDGTLDADWHRGRLTAAEARLLRQQQDSDRRAKQARRDATIRSMLRAPL